MYSLEQRPLRVPDAELPRECEYAAGGCRVGPKLERDADLDRLTEREADRQAT